MPTDQWWISRLEALSQDMADASRYEYGGGSELWMLDAFIDEAKKKIAEDSIITIRWDATPQPGKVVGIGCGSAPTGDTPQTASWNPDTCPHPIDRIDVPGAKCTACGTVFTITAT